MKSNLINISVEAVKRLLYVIPKSPEVAQIEITNRCNFNCQMCQRFDLKVPIKDMDIKTFEKILSKLSPIKEVILTGWGEPLIHPKIIEMILLSKEYGKKVSFTTNGSLMTKEIASKILKTKIDSISFSVDDVSAPKSGSLVHPVTSQIKNIETFLKLSKNYDSKPKVIIQTTLHKGEEKKVSKVIEWASKIGADMVNLNRLDVRFNKKLARPSYKEEKILIEKFESIGKKNNIIVEFKAHAAFNGIVRTIYKIIAPYLALGGSHCLRVYNYIYINQKGEATPCCALPLWSVGNLLNEDLSKIWKSNKFNKFRQTGFQRVVCNGCDVLEIKQIKPLE